MKTFWWNAKKDEVGDQINSLIENLSDNTERHDQMAFFSSIYANKSISSLEPQDHAMTNGWVEPSDVTLNITRSMVDTITAKIAKTKPTIKAVTTDGSWKDRRIAKRINSFVDGITHDLDLWKHTKKAFVDAAIWGNGIIRVNFDGSDICLERVMPHNLLVDPEEAFINEPRSMHQIRYVDSSILISMYPSKEYEIEEAQGRNVLQSNLVRVVESWHLKSSPKAKDGRFVRTISGCVLEDQKWNKDSFPFAILRWPPHPQVQFWSQGLVEQLIDIQSKINEMMDNINESIRLTARPVVFVQKGSEVKAKSFDRTFGAIIEYVGQPPKWTTTDAVPPAAVQHLERLMSYAYRIAGVSELNAAARKEPGITAGVAIREMEDIQSERFSQVQQAYEDFIVDILWLVLDLARDIEIAGKKEINLSVPGLDFIKDMHLADIELKDARFRIIVHSASSLPSTPAGRIEFIQEMIQAGIIEQERALELLDMPDIEAVRTKKGAQRRVFEKMVMRFLEADPDDQKELEAAYRQPEPYQDLELGIKIFLEALLEAEEEDAPESILQLLRDWIDDAKALMQQQEAAMAPPAPSPQAPMPQEGGNLLAQPAPLPQSDLMPGGGLQ